jgi:hypothetical protein
MLAKLTEKPVHFSVAKQNYMKIQIVFARNHELIHYNLLLYNGKYTNTNHRYLILMIDKMPDWKRVAVTQGIRSWMSVYRSVSISARR